MQHLGEILEKEIRQSSFPISKLAKRIGYTRQHMYNLFAQPKIDYALLEEIGKIINVDFSTKIKALKKYSTTANEELQVLKETREFNYNTIDFEKLNYKYLTLLEEHNKLLVEYQKLLKQKLAVYLKKILK